MPVAVIAAAAHQPLPWPVTLPSPLNALKRFLARPLLSLTGPCNAAICATGRRPTPVVVRVLDAQTHYGPKTLGVVDASLHSTMRPP
ncbi:hypothetical protein GALMADRAFT_228239 [Galerina marginata CBS 339.88]|uniref:Uncharacterized protein n=1 Tax=Galerina marginata (strain CBS 339.88) TaxID=685588 RepID=A0A067SUR3_GALM3|nr:hypothetical protein GALMADRAFT_228239 [Galerina marginata CBS 339.88]